MAITPRSRGLGNIGSIVNRQRMASPTRPMAKMPVPKPAPRPMAAPVRPNTTTFGQRQASQPFRSATKPMARVNPMQAQYDQMKNVPMAPPPGGFQMMPNVNQKDLMNSLESMRVPQPQPFNPQPNPGQQPFKTGDDYGFQPVDYGYGPGIVDPVSGQVPEFLKNLRPVAGGPSNIYGQPNPGQPVLDPFMGGPYKSRPDLGPGVGFGAGLPNPNDFPGLMPGMMDDRGMGGPGSMGYGVEQQFGNPNPMSSDYNQLEGSAFNTNPSNSGGFMSGGGGSMFGGGGFAGR